MNISGEVAIVTGAGGTGCGRAIAVRFAARDSAVVVSDINEAGGHETVRSIEQKGGRAALVRAGSENPKYVRASIGRRENSDGTESST